MRASACFLFAPILLFGEISYHVNFQGLEDSRTLKAVRSVSQLESLQTRPPSSASALRFRADSDVPEMIRVLHAYGYYEAEIHVLITEQFKEYKVQIEIDPGPRYTLEDYQLKLIGQGSQPSPSFDLSDLGLEKGDPAISQDLLDAEKQVLNLLSECGYPLAKNLERHVTADGKTKKIIVELDVETGPLCRFGEVEISGNCSVKDLLVCRKISWKRGEVYNSALIDLTQKKLMDSGLFCSASVQPIGPIDEEGQLPLRINLAESKHKSVSLGASYQKTFGLGATLGWENRNVAGMGRRLSLQADIAQRSHSGVATYLIPDAWTIGQDLVLQAEAARETITAYHDQDYHLLTRLDWQIDERLYVSAGVKSSYLIVSSSVDNGNFFLIESPIKLRWSSVCDLLNPIRGTTVDWRLIPSINTQNSADYYASQQLSIAGYIPLLHPETLILAQKATIGTIFSNGLSAIPVPRRLFGGSEENLRGYKYLTVSPLDEEGKPTGGRLALFYSFETRFRFGDFGLVPFFDCGAVARNPWFPLHSKWRKSVGLGFRYFSFAGPLRLDLAFPLNRRQHLDPSWWIFVSIGQSF